MHISLGRPLISAEHEPHLPALQFQRTARSGACSAWILCTASSTTIPSPASTANSWRCPEPFVPRKIRNRRCSLTSRPFLDEPGEVGGKVGLRFPLDPPLASLASHDAPSSLLLAVRLRLVWPGVAAATCA